MIELSRRQVLRGSAALAAGAALGGAGALLERARAWAGDMPFQPEPGASLRALRWTPALAAEGAQLERNVAAFSAATGIDVRLDSEFIDDIEPKAAVAANVGEGPDLIWGLDMTPHLFPEQLIDLSEVARHLGERYGGWCPDRRDLRPRPRGQVDLPAGLRPRQRHRLPPELARGCRLRALPGDRRRPPQAQPGARSGWAIPAASRSATPAPTPTPGCTG